MRIGQGYDVHKIVSGRPLILGGINIPWDRGLLGHSDADVLLHAIMDAVLGACGLQDIGVHFPDTDMRYSGANSSELFARVIALAAEKGYEVGNIDAVIIAQNPKLMAYLPAMKVAVAAIAGVDDDRVNIKATTEEKLGFTGAEAGMAAMAVCLMTRCDNRL